MSRKPRRHRAAADAYAVEGREFPMTPRGGRVPWHVELLRDPDEMYRVYDRSARDLIDVVRHEGYFNGLAADLAWPVGRRDDGTLDASGLDRRVELVNAVYRGVPPLRDDRLSEAYGKLAAKIPAYHEATRLYLRLRDQMVERGIGTERDLLRLYQTVYVEELAVTDLLSPDAGEASLVTMHLARVPLSHAQSVAEELSTATGDDPAWEERFAIPLDDATFEGTLRDLLHEVARRTLDTMAAGELFATRYNTYHNFGVLGSSFWKVLVEADRVLGECRERTDDAANALAGDVRTGHAMTIEFFRAHTEDPSRLKPTGYWYGQEYSYLTRDMIDLAVRMVKRANALAESAEVARRLELPPLFDGTMTGRFLEYPHVGRRGDLSNAARAWRLARWMRASWRFGRGKARIARQTRDASERHRRAWEGSLRWGRESLRAFDIKVKVTIDPSFRTIARELDLTGGGRKVLFLPTHQSLHDHPVMYEALRSPELIEAMGWSGPQPCVILARTGLARAGLKVGPLDITMFGTSAARFDELLESVDGYITLERAAASKHTTSRVVEALEGRPGIVYPMATTAAFPGQVFPLQHALFSQLPEDLAIIPVALRGIHSLWPKCPKGNFDINSGLVEVVVLPPMLGETTFMPKRRSLRIQLETAALFQAFQIVALLNPESTDAPVPAHASGAASVPA